MAVILSDHVGDVLVQNGHAMRGGAGQFGPRVIHAVFDGTVLEVIGQLCRGHDGAVVLGLRGGGPPDAEWR